MLRAPADSIAVRPPTRAAGRVRVPGSKSISPGTTIRPLAGILAGRAFRTVTGGDGSLQRRPMRRIIEPLTRMGARIDSDGGRAPLTIDGGGLQGIVYEPELPSAQVESGVLLAGLHAAGRTRVVEPAPTRDHTERALEAFGVTVIRDGPAAEVTGGQRLESRMRLSFGECNSFEVAPGDVPGVIDGIPALAEGFRVAPTTIAGASSVDVSYPGFFDELARLTR